MSTNKLHDDFVRFASVGVDAQNAAFDVEKEWSLLNDELRAQIQTTMPVIDQQSKRIRAYQEEWRATHQFLLDHSATLSLYARIRRREEQEKLLSNMSSAWREQSDTIGGLYSSYGKHWIADGKRSTTSRFLSRLWDLNQSAIDGVEKNTQLRIEIGQRLSELENQRRARRKVRARAVYQRTNKGAMREKQAMDFARSRAHLLPVPPMVNSMPTWTHGKWQGTRYPLMDNELTQVHLLVSVDNHGRIENRIVQKTSVLEKQEWSSPTRFRGPGNRMVPLEWYIQTIVAAAAQSRFSLMTLGYPQLNDAQQSYTFNMPYTPCGTLLGLVESHCSGQSVRISGQFLWQLLQALAEWAVIMKQGGIMTPTGGWQEVIHRDLKPANVFLDSPNPGHFPLYPRPVVADYGYGFFTSAADNSNPTIWTDYGTEGYYPPEQLSFIDANMEEPIDAFKMLSPCNVWGIGAIMHTLINHSVPFQPSYLDGESHENRLGGHLANTYDRELCAKVDECLNFDPLERPKVEDLLQWVNAKIQANRYLRDANNGIQNAAQTQELRFNADNQYRIGMAARR